MNDDYLWDRSGTPDPDLLYLERMLPRVREQVRRASVTDLELALAPRARPRQRFAVAAAALAAALVASLGTWQLTRRARVPEPIGREPRTELEVAAPAPSAPEPAKLSPAPTPEPPREPRSLPAPPPPKSPAPAPSAAEEAEPEAAAARSASEIARVVAKHRSEVRARCWEPALAKRKDGASPTVKLTVSFTIEANGRPSSVKAGASPPDYPSLASCVATEVRGWDFGPAEGSISVAVPFVFTEE